MLQQAGSTHPDSANPVSSRRSTKFTFFQNGGVVCVGNEKVRRGEIVRVRTLIDIDICTWTKVRIRYIMSLKEDDYFEAFEV
jgi:hypothetical protein